MDTPELHTVIVVSALIGFLLVLSFVRAILGGCAAGIAVLTFPFRCAATGCCWIYHACGTTDPPNYLLDDAQ